MPFKCRPNCHSRNGKCCFYCVCLQDMALWCTRSAASLEFIYEAFNCFVSGWVFLSFFFSHLFLRWGCRLLTKCLDFYCSIWVYFIRHFIALNFIVIIFLKAFLTQNQSHIKMASQYLKWSKQLQPASFAVHLFPIKALANFRALVYLPQMWCDFTNKVWAFQNANVPSNHAVKPCFCDWGRHVFKKQH